MTKTNPMALLSKQQVDSARIYSEHTGTFFTCNKCGKADYGACYDMIAYNVKRFDAAPESTVFMLCKDCYEALYKKPKKKMDIYNLFDEKDKENDS